MKNYLKNIAALAIMITLNTALFAKNVEGEIGGIKTNPGSQVVNAKGANCVPRTGVQLLEFNNVSTLLQQGGLLYRNIGSAGSAAYEVPKGSGLTVIYAGSLWMGGVDVNGQLKLAGVTFQARGHDFWPGPLSVKPGTGNYDPTVPAGDDMVRDFGPANIDPDVCVEYDKFFTIRKGEVERFVLFYNCSVDPEAEGCEEVVAPTNEELNRIYNWPAHGDISRAQDYYLAPFYDNDGDGNYNPLNGDYPWYDDILGRDDVACGVDRRITLFGDETHWWVFNDKGNVHGESGGDPIGMEIRAQAFAFGTNDEINNMTFYNYELINRGTQTLFQTFFSQYIDADIGNAADDYAGCDVSRGLGYTFNGDLLDESGGSQKGYGENPPAIGVDFFEGPYQDADGRDNIGPKYDSVSKTFIAPSVGEAIADNGIVYRGIGTGYSDGIVDNERFGMRRYTYYTNGGPASQSDPSNANEFYRYMSGFWRDGSETFFGGTGYPGGTGVTEINCDYMFPGDSDPLLWATKGIDPNSEPWTEATENNEAGDRRFVQSAGPFTLRPGAVNNITLGVVYGRGSEGELFSSVDVMKRADTKAQALFDNCFRILNPPDAPRLRIQELENELILMIDNPATSNNFKERYEEEDKINIVDEGVDRFYRFEGYQIFQLKSESNSVNDITDPNAARLIAQCDIVNFEKDENGNDIPGRPIDRIINFEFDEALGFAIPVEKVKGENKGIRHSFRITDDQFAQGERRLVNHKTYHFVAIAYAYNNFSDYDPADPLLLGGQKIPYIASRIGYDKNSIQPVSAIPHNPRPELGGTGSFIEYGSSPEITRLDGHGNGGQILELTKESEDFIVANGFKKDVTYKKGAGPINVKVIDPLNLKDGYYECIFKEYTGNASNTGADTASWTINRYDTIGGELLGSVNSEVTINTGNEQLIPDWGVSVMIQQNLYYRVGLQSGPKDESTDLLDVSLTYADSSKQWLSFVTDRDGFQPQNWIRAGAYEYNATNDGAFDPAAGTANAVCYKDELNYDPKKQWASILGGGIAPHRLVGYQCDFQPLAYYKSTLAWPNGPEESPGGGRNNAGLAFLPSIDIVFTEDKSLWTKCPVIELGRDASLNIGNAKTGTLRKSASVDKNGNPIAGTGMGWFPGYAIDIESGARLFMAFGENSFLGNDNGGDMIWNPSSRLTDGVGTPKFGGMHAIYVFNYKAKEINGLSSLYDMGEYSESSTQLTDLFNLVTSNDGAAKAAFYSSLAWVGFPLTTPSRKPVETEARLRIRVNKEYKTFVATGNNGGKPMYSWDMSDIYTRTGSDSDLADALDLINVVPNPYYAYSDYERGRLDTRVKITNLPDVCEIKIYTTNGKLIRTFKKDSPITSIDWDLNNHKGIPVASGVYLIHVSVPNIGDRIVKFYGAMREVDLQGI